MWAEGQVVEAEQKKASLYSGNENAGMDLEDGEAETEAAEELVELDALPAQGQEAFGGAKIHP